LHVTVGLEVAGPGGGQWSCRWQHSQLVEVRPGHAAHADVRYRMNADTFAAIVTGRQTARDAFFARHIEVEGDLERALKLALIFERFLQESPYQPDVPSEASDAIPAIA